MTMLGRRVAFRRYVRTAEGSRRYELPIGAPIEAHDRPGGGRHRAPETSAPASLPPTLRPSSQPSPDELAADYRTQVQPTADEIAIADAYQGPGMYKKVNKRLRIGETLAGRPAEVAAGLDQLMQRHQTSQPLRVFRGMGNFVPADTSPGAVIEDLGFSSSTLSEDVAKEFSGDGVSLDITVPTGFNAVVVNGAVDDPDLGWEKELLLPRGTRYVILSEETREGKRWLNVVALPPTAATAPPLLSSGSPASTTANPGSWLAIGRRVRKPSRLSLRAGFPLGSSGVRRTAPRVDGGVWFRVRYVRTAAGSRRYGVPIGSPIPTGRKVRNRTMPDGSTRLRLTPAQRAVAGRVFGEDSGPNGASNSGGVSLDVDNPTAAAKALDGLASEDLTPGQRRTVRVLRDKIAGLTGPANDETSADTGQPTAPDSPETPSPGDDMPGDPATAPARSAIRDAYDELAPPDRTSTSGDPAWIGLADLRKQLDDQGLSRGEVDAALEEMASEPGVYLQAEANQRSLTPEDRAAGITVGGDTRHLIRIEKLDDEPGPDAPDAPDAPAPVSAPEVADDFRSKVTLSKAENRALARWNSSAFSMINGYLRGGQGTEGGQADAEAMEALMGRYELPGPVTAFRALGPDALDGGDQTGRVITSPGFSSVALDRPAGGEFADRTRYPVLMELDIPEGMNGIAVEGTEHAWPDQREFVLPNNSRFVVESDVTVDGVRHVKATVQPPEVSS